MFLRVPCENMHTFVLQVVVHFRRSLIIHDRIPVKESHGYRTICTIVHTLSNILLHIKC